MDIIISFIICILVNSQAACCLEMICSFQVHISKYLLCKSWRPFRLCWHSYLSYCWTHAFNGSNSKVLMRTRHLPSGRSTWSMKKCRVTNCPADNKLSRESSPASVRLERDAVIDTEQLYIRARIKAHELLPRCFPYCSYEDLFHVTSTTYNKTNQDNGKKKKGF